MCPCPFKRILSSKLIQSNMKDIYKQRNNIAVDLLGNLLFNSTE